MTPEQRDEFQQLSTELGSNLAKIVYEAVGEKTFLTILKAMKSKKVLVLTAQKNLIDSQLSELTKEQV